MKNNKQIGDQIWDQAAVIMDQIESKPRDHIILNIANPIWGQVRNLICEQIQIHVKEIIDERTYELKQP